MTPQEALGNKVFASTVHNYETDTSEIIINPVKCGNTENMIERLGELRDKGYLPRGLTDDQLADYVFTHEFGHSLIDMGSPLNNGRNWVGANYEKVRTVRSEVMTIFEEYTREIGRLEREISEAEMEFIYATDNDTFQRAAERAGRLRREVESIKISTYSLTNADEFVAESFAAVRFGATSSPYAIRCAALLDENFGR